VRVKPPLALPGVDQRLDLAPLRLGEVHVCDKAPGLAGIVVLDSRFEMLAQGDRLRELPAEPPQQADAGL
jgi:hypothetical protein